MRKEDEKLIRKKQMAEHMLNSIDAKYIKQAADYRPKNNRNTESVRKVGKTESVGNAESIGIVKSVRYAGIAKVAIAACIIVALVLFIGRNNFNNNKNNNSYNEVAQSQSVEIKENNRLHLSVGKNEEKLLTKGMKVNVGKYEFSVESSQPGIPIIATDSQNGNSKITVKSDSGIIRVEKDGAYETIEKQTTITSGQTIFWSPSPGNETTAEAVICLFENEKIVSGVVVNIIPYKNSTYIVKYVDDVDIINQYEEVKGKLEAVKASQYDIEKDLQRGAVPENKIKAAKSKNNKYKGFIKKYEKKINEMKNNQKLVDEFLEDYNKITEK